MTNTLQHTATHCNTLQHFSLDGKLSCELRARNSILASRVARAIHITQFSNTHDSIHRTRVARATHVSQFSNTYDSIQQHTWLHSATHMTQFSNTHDSILTTQVARAIHMTQFSNTHDSILATRVARLQINSRNWSCELETQLQN